MHSTIISAKNACRFSLLTALAIIAIQAVPLASAHAATIEVRCKNGWPFLSVDSYWIDQQLESNVVPSAFYVDTDTDYNRRWMEVTDMWTIDGGFKANFDWDVWQRQDFPGDWYGAEGSGNYTVNAWMDDSVLHINMGDIDMDNDYVGWVLDWLGVNAYFEQLITSYLRQNFGGEQIWVVVSDYMEEAFSGFGISASDTQNVVQWLADWYLWIRIGHNYTDIGVDWNRYFDEYHDALSTQIWNAIDAMCPLTKGATRGSSRPARP